MVILVKVAGGLLSQEGCPDREGLAHLPGTSTIWRLAEWG